MIITLRRSNSGDVIVLHSDNIEFLRADFSSRNLKCVVGLKSGEAFFVDDGLDSIISRLGWESEVSVPIGTKS